MEIFFHKYYIFSHSFHPNFSDNVTGNKYIFLFGLAFDLAHIDYIIQLVQVLSVICG